MYKYRIKVEQIGGEWSPEFAEVYGDGIECEGFLLVGKAVGGAHVSIHNMNLLDIALSIKSDKHLINAAKLVCLTDKLDFLKEDKDDD